jgi:CRP/FNR family cyclic AMP-dependent transcriptional regulator
MSWVDVLGYAASATVLATFCTSTMISLRILALVSNVLFCSYGYFDHLYPVLILHAALFPINLLRLVQLVISAATEAGVKAGRTAPASAKQYLTSNLNP